MVFQIAQGIAYILAGIGLIVLMCAFIPGDGRQVQEVDWRFVKFKPYRLVLFRFGWTLCFGGLSLVAILLAYKQIQSALAQ